MFSAEGISVALAGKKILNDISFDAKAGTLTAIVGPNGSGKTTLLKAVTGDTASGGRVTLNGHALSELKPWQLAAIRGVLPQATTLAFPFTAIEVVRIGLQGGVSGDQGHLALQALRRVGLIDKATRFYQELSGGEQQRVQLARVLAQIWEPIANDGSPRWLFLDEPVSALDIAHQLEVMNIAADFAKRGGGVLAVMHDLNLTALYADQVLVVYEGQLLASGAPRDIMTNDILSKAYGCNVRINAVPDATATFLLPHAASLRHE